MLKTLLKKQFLSMLGQLGMNRKESGNKKRRGAGAYVGLIAALSLLMGVVFFGYSTLICAPLNEAGLGWLYFTYAGILGVTLSVVGSVFMTQNCLYEAKDNELLMSLPIPSGYVLFIRMVPLYVQNLIFCAVVLLPAMISWCIFAAVTVAQIIIWVLMLVIVPVFALFVTCLLALLLALITSRMRDKTIVTMLLSIAFIVAYFIVYAMFMNNMTALVDNAEGIAEGIKGAVYPLYKFGTACTGDFVGFAIIFAINVVTFGGLYLVLSKTYIKLITAKHGGFKAKYKGKPERRVSCTAALLKKETRRFFSNGMYFLNCGLGVILLLIATVLFIIKGSSLMEELSAIPLIKDYLPVVIIEGVSLVCVMDDVSAPSISLEGKTLWILQSTPARAWDVLKAKLIMHYLVTAPAATVCSAVFAIFITPSWGMIILMLVAPSVAVSLAGVFGLVYNLLMPKLEWDNETVAIKNSMSVLATMLTCWGIMLISVGVFVGFAIFAGMELATLACLVIWSALTAGMAFWLKRKGTRIFAELQ